ncbi:hypothetical protein HDU78_006640 [Chytriomyces hyalinus]|nr:hypothetical protein HDU78_006640 [Chytriomyces hyalinus]
MLHTNSAAGDFRRLRQIRSKIMNLHQSALCSPSQVEELRSMGVELKGLSQTSLGRIIAALAEQTVANLLRIHANAYGLKTTLITSNCSTPSSKRKPRDAYNVASNSSTEGYSNPRSLLCIAAEAVAVGFAPGLSVANRRTSGSSFESISVSTPASFGEECDKSDESESESDTESEDEEPMSDDQFYQTFIPEHLQR